MVVIGGEMPSNYRISLDNRVQAETQTCDSVLLLADDEDSRSFLSHRRKTLYHHVVHQSVFIFFLIPPFSFSCLTIGCNLFCKSLRFHRLGQLIGHLL